MVLSFIFAITRFISSFYYEESSNGEQVQESDTVSEPKMTSTVTEVKQLPNEMAVSLTGYIEKALENEIYLFKSSNIQEAIKVKT